MLHVKQLFNKIRNLPIQELAFYLFVVSLPFQIRTILNPADAYIGYYFSYHQSFFIYLSDILFLAFFLANSIYSKNRVNPIILLPILLSSLYLFHVEQIDLLIYNILRIFQFLLIIAYLLRNQTVSRGTIWILICLGTFEAFLAIIQFHIQGPIGIPGEYVPASNMEGASTIANNTLRAYGTFPHPNVLGGYLTVCLGLLLYVSRETYRRWHNILQIIILWGLLVTFSRSAWVAAFISLNVYGILLLKEKALKRLVFWVFILIVSCGTLGFAYKSHLFPRISQNSANTEAITYRQEFNNYGTQILKNNWLVGVGPGQYIETLRNTQSLKPWEHQPPHNIYLFLLIEIGVLGAFIAVYTLNRLGFTWNILKTSIFWFVMVPVGLIGLLDHYFLTIQPTLLLLALVLPLSIIFPSKSRN